MLHFFRASVFAFLLSCSASFSVWACSPAELSNLARLFSHSTETPSSIRELGEAHRAEINALVAKAFDGARPSEADYLNYTFFGRFEDSKLVASLALQQQPDHSTLYWVASDPAYRGRGFVKELIGYVRQNIVPAEHSLWASTDIPDFYTKLGAVVVSPALEPLNFLPRKDPIPASKFTIAWPASGVRGAPFIFTGVPSFPLGLPMHLVDGAYLTHALTHQMDRPWIFNSADIRMPYVRYLYGPMHLSSFEGELLMVGHPDENVTVVFDPFVQDEQEAAQLLAKLFRQHRKMGQQLRAEGLRPQVAQYLRELLPEIEIKDLDAPTYIYRTEDLRKFEGPKYKSQRRRSNQFNGEFPEAQFLDLRQHPEKLPLLRPLVEKWLKEKQFAVLADAKEAEAEVRALYEAIDRFQELNLYGGVLIVGETVIAFSLGVKKDTKTLASLHAKADRSYQGAYQENTKRFAQLAFDRGYEFLDFQSDSGQGNLRLTKMEYHPVKLIPWLRAEFGIQP